MGRFQIIDKNPSGSTSLFFQGADKKQDFPEKDILPANDAIPQDEGSNGPNKEKVYQTENNSEMEKTNNQKFQCDRFESNTADGIKEKYQKTDNK